MKSTTIFRYGFLACITVVALGTIETEAQNVLRDDPYAARKIFYEEHWQQKIEAALKYVEGAVVAVDVELSPDVEKTVQTEEFDERTAVEYEITKSAAGEVDGSSDRGDAQGPSGGSMLRATETRDKESYSKYIVPRTQTTTTIAGLVPTRVSVAVSVPTSYYEAVWQHRNGDKPVEELTPKDKASKLSAIENDVRVTIENTVVMLLPPRLEGENRYKDVQVESFESLGSTNAARDRLTKLMHPNSRARRSLD